MPDALISARESAAAGRKPKESPPPKTDDQRRARKSSANKVLCIIKTALTHCVNRNLVDSPDRP
jgi:hypothetical protein